MRCYISSHKFSTSLHMEVLRTNMSYFHSLTDYNFSNMTVIFLRTKIKFGSYQT